MRPKIKEYQAGDVAKYAHLKYDGYFCKLVFNDWPRFYSKNDNEFEVGRLSESMFRLPAESIVLGELIAPGKMASYVPTAIKRREELRFIAFAVHGIELLEETGLWCIKHGIEFAPYYGPRESCGSHWLGEFSGVPDLRGTEGIVFKDGAWTNWRRYKPTKTIDLIVDDITDGDGKYIGLVGSLVCKTAEGDVVANVSGFTDEERFELSSKDIGRVVEVAYQYVGSKKKLRHPRFVRFRDDKGPQECTRDQDPDLVP
jgi:sporulation protein YlmC with PRC-barrel domain